MKGKQTGVKNQEAVFFFQLFSSSVCFSVWKVHLATMKDIDYFSFISTIKFEKG